MVSNVVTLKEIERLADASTASGSVWCHLWRLALETLEALYRNLFRKNSMHRNDMKTQYYSFPGAHSGGQVVRGTCGVNICNVRSYHYLKPFSVLSAFLMKQILTGRRPACRMTCYRTMV